MGPALAVGTLSDAAPKLGIVLAAIAAAGVLLDRDARRRCGWMVLALVLAGVILIGHIADTDQFRSLTDDGARFVGLCVAAALAVVLLGLVFVARPSSFPLLVVAVLPFRVPIDAAGTTTNLLVPLYLVIAGGCAAFAWRTLAGRGQARDRARISADRGQARGRADERTGADRGQARGRVDEGTGMFDGVRGDPVRLLCVALGAFLVLYAVQALYSDDFDTALEQVVFFLVPFALLFALLREVRWTREVALGCLGVLAALAVVFAGIGFWEYERRELLWNPKVIAANQFESYFRVNSVFWDPNVYGRFLALVMIALAAFMLWSRRPAVALATGGVLAVLWGGLVLTFSQSSFAAVLAGLAVLAALRWDVRRTVAAAAVVLALGGVIAVAFQDALKIDLGSSSGLNKVTSGRADLIGGGLELFANRPLQGYGSGAFGRAYRLERKGNQQQAVSASHTMPVTVAAEQGLVGLAAYLAVVAAALLTLFGDGAFARRAPPAADGTSSGGLRVARAALAAMFVALVVHTMVYAAFLEDPFTWVILAAGASLAPLARLREAHVPVPSAQPRRVPATA